MKKNGFTLVEGVLSIFFLGVALVGVLYVFGGSVSTGVVADQMAVALNLAEEKMERIIADKAAFGYGTVVNNRRGVYYSDIPASPYSGYKRAVTFVYIMPHSAPDGDSVDDFATTSGSDTNFAKVTVMVSWNNNKNTLVLNTLLSNWTAN